MTKIFVLLDNEHARTCIAGLQLGYFDVAYTMHVNLFVRYFIRNIIGQFFLVINTAHIVCGEGSNGRVSVRPSVCLSVPSIDSCQRHSRLSIDSSAGARAAAAGSVTLRDEVRGSTQTYL